MNPTMLPVARAPRGLRGWHVAAIFAAFFATIFLVNGVMMYSAISTHTGIVANEPYRKGLHYNDRIAADTHQAQLGWTDTVAVTRDGHVTVALAAGEARPITGMHVEAQLGRPSTNRHDIRLVLKEAASGRYEAEAGALEAGNWIVALEVRTDSNAADPIYRMRRRLWLKQ